MAAYQLIIIMFCIVLFGFAYSAFYDPVEKIIDSSGISEDPQLAGTEKYIYPVWKYLPLVALALLSFYGIAVTQKG